MMTALFFFSSLGNDQVAWLYNIRGSDVDYSPVVHAYAVVTLDSAFFYVDKRKVSSEVRDPLAFIIIASFNSNVQFRDLTVSLP